HKQISTPALWRIATPVGAGAIHPIGFVRVPIVRGVIAKVTSGLGPVTGQTQLATGCPILNTS
ncbi:hypothetical protein, partial [uncultured Tateyamaria sp.]|uniref:hypothetical protein n=1 Tax=Tateyamaria sp. 1078 TaxID=3417464 RepID=UPI00261660A7